MKCRKADITFLCWRLLTRNPDYFFLNKNRWLNKTTVCTLHRYFPRSFNTNSNFNIWRKIYNFFRVSIDVHSERVFYVILLFREWKPNDCQHCLDQFQTHGIQPSMTKHFFQLAIRRSQLGKKKYQFSENLWNFRW